MRFPPLAAVMILFLSLIAMGCTDDDSNESPNAVLKLEPNMAWIYDNATGVENPEITFNATGSNDPDGKINNYHYEFGEGNFTDFGDATYDRTYTQGGYYTTGLTVQDDEGDEDSTNQVLRIAYQYLRDNQIIEGTTSPGSNDHPFAVSEFHPDTGIVFVNVTVTDVGNPTVRIVVLNEDGDEVKSDQSDVTDTHNFTINLYKQDFDAFGYGQWSVRVECENGNIQYNITVQIRYRR